MCVLYVRYSCCKMSLAIWELDVSEDALSASPIPDPPSPVVESSSSYSIPHNPHTHRPTFSTMGTLHTYL